MIGSKTWDTGGLDTNNAVPMEAESLHLSLAARGVRVFLVPQVGIGSSYTF